MKKHHWQRLGFLSAICCVVALAVYLVLYALGQNVNLFYTPTQVNAGEAPTEHVVRVGGMVLNGSLKRASDSLATEFTLSDGEQQIRIFYIGILPDLFREGQGVIVRGKLTADNKFKAEEVLAKHDENYMPPEVKSTLKNKGQWQSIDNKDIN